MGIVDPRGYTRLIAAIANVYRSTAQSAAAAPPMLARAAEFLTGFDAHHLSTSAATRKPVCRHLAAATRAARGGPLEDLADAFMTVEPISDWRQNPNYSAEAMGKNFVENYGYVELVGPGRPISSNEFLIGFLLIGPGTLYPDHSHPAAETYHVVAGAAEWWRQDRDWVVLPPGAAIVHAPSVRHAMRARHEPLLALYCWQGAIATAARLTDAAR